jgi:predicted DNA-binding protein
MDRKKKVNNVAKEVEGSSIVFRARMNAEIYKKLRILSAIKSKSFSLILEEAVDLYLKKKENSFKIEL